MQNLTNNTKILVIDDEDSIIKLLENILTKQGYTILKAYNGIEALDVLKYNPDIDLILLDIVMPKMDGYETCKQIKSTETYKNIPIFFLTGLNDLTNQDKGYKLGAVEFLEKPLNMHTLEMKINIHIELKQYRDTLESLVDLKTKEIKAISHFAIDCMATLAEFRDNETGLHIKRTQNYIKILAEELSKTPKYQNQLDEKTTWKFRTGVYYRVLPKHKNKLNERIINLLYRSAPLHDIGKIVIPDSILLKAEKLTVEEFEIMKTHAIKGQEILLAAGNKIKNNPFLAYAIDIAGTHHEKWDGTGYPFKLKGEDIPLCGRLMAIADVYDALINKRVYKPAFSHNKAVKIIKESSGTQFDPDIVEVFLKVESRFDKISKKYIDKDTPCESVSR